MKNRSFLTWRTLPIILCFGFSVLTGFAQNLAPVDIRFSQPVFRPTDRTYSVDVEMKTREQKEALFGINVRFFFDATLLEFKSLENFQPGYNITGNGIQSFTGNPTSGAALFNFNGAATYINGAVQLMDERLALDIHQTHWTRVFSVRFSVPKQAGEPESFCPAMVWDQKVYGQRGGFIGGSDGVIITVLEQKRDTRQETLPTQAFGAPFNWSYHPNTAQPFGAMVSAECISLAELVATDDPDQVVGGYKLYQNQPNPFDSRTTIDFVLPSAQEASLIFFDADGKILEELRGYYEAGRNQVELKQRPWMRQSNVFYYRLQTDKFTSQAKSMNVVRA